MKKLLCSLLYSLVVNAAVVPACVFAQAPPSAPIAPVAPMPPAFIHNFGTLPTGAEGQSCSVLATAPKGSAEKGQQIKFVLDSARGAASGRAWQYFVVSTGRSKSLAQVQAMFADAFARAPSAPAGAELCLLGDIKYGGEVHVVSRGGGAVELVYNPSMTIGNPVLSPGQTTAFAKLLGN